MRDFSPAVLAIVSWGLVTGIAMSKSVLTLPQALGMSLLCYAGSSQLAVLPLLAAKLPLWTVLLTAAMVNLRFVIFSAGLAPHFSYLPMWRRVCARLFQRRHHLSACFRSGTSRPASCPARRRSSGAWRSELVVVAGVVDRRDFARGPDSR